MKAKLTKQLLGAMKQGERIFDASVAGMYAERGARVISLRAKGDLWRAGKLEGTRTTTLGRFGVDGLDLDAARARAKAWLGEIQQGRDPNEPATAVGGLTVEKAFERYLEHLRERPRPAAQRTVEEFERLTTRKRWGDLLDRPLLSIKPSELAALHKSTTQKKIDPETGRELGGDVAANKMMRAYRSAYRLAHLRADDQSAFDVRITRAVAWREETPRRDRVAMREDDFPKWFAAVQKLSNPLRRLLAEVQLFSGLRPGNLISIRRSQIDLEKQTITFPRDEMKSRKRKGDFVLPLSTHLERLIRKALALGDLTHEGTEWLWPARDGGHVAVVREPTLGKHWGHALRTAYSTQATAIEVDPILVEILLDHAVAGGGVAGVYKSTGGLSGPLRAAQERITLRLLELTRGKK